MNPFRSLLILEPERTVIANDLGRRLRLERGLCSVCNHHRPDECRIFLIENVVMNTINVEMIEHLGLDRAIWAGTGSRALTASKITRCC